MKADFNGDGLDDVGLFYDYGNGHVALFTMTGHGCNSFDPPVLRWDAPHWGGGTKFVVAGDFSGDGTSDIALFYDYGNGHVAVFTLYADINRDGGLSGPTLGWDAPHWGSGTKFVRSGNFTGYFQDDLALFYDYGNGHVAVFTLYAKIVGGFGSLRLWWDAPHWGVGTKFVDMGNFNGVSPFADTMAMFYDYGNGHVAVFTLTISDTPSGEGPYMRLSLRWDAPHWGNGTRFVNAGDFNGDGIADVSLVYDYGHGHVALFTLSGTFNGGSFPGAVRRWDAPHWGGGTKFVTTGDYSGDRIADFSLFYDYGNGHVGLLSLTANSSRDGGFSGPVTGWNALHWGSGTKVII
ncbi:hypothetical protein HC031_05045 [Planosporangium thailandense]|uniref:VCBS repeat-containing protein n=1 Tax=Planosporangium thailandense TaxID=765197 RepID=A0ABX0XTI2_9ACTN|nr:hypothetical protein [Planosporangium thailandense]NJC69093.1 hypothetical protein [Planosporangium thailandense]